MMVEKSKIKNFSTPMASRDLPDPVLGILMDKNSEC